jgi:hypothetical protein
MKVGSLVWYITRGRPGGCDAAGRVVSRERRLAIVTGIYDGGGEGIYDGGGEGNMACIISTDGEEWPELVAELEVAS